jgi:hypothetical protein
MTDGTPVPCADDVRSTFSLSTSPECAWAFHKAAPDATYEAMRDRSKQASEELYDRISRRLLVHLVRRMHDVDAATELWA